MRGECKHRVFGYTDMPRKDVISTVSFMDLQKGEPDKACLEKESWDNKERSSGEKIR